MLEDSRDVAKELETAGDERFTATLWLAPKKTQAGWNESGLDERKRRGGAGAGVPEAPGADSQRVPA